jgi:RNA polymerase sigma-70 factor (ECF subfamily)
VSAEQRFEELYRQYAARVYAYALRRTSAAGADDAVADVFLVAWRRLDDLPPEPLPWLLGTAHKVLANRRRGERRALALRDRLASQPREPAAAPAALDHRVGAALASLGERDRELLMLVAWEGLSVTEAAEALGVRAGTVAVRLHRARQRFARALAHHDAPLNTMTEVGS